MSMKSKFIVVLAVVMCAFTAFTWQADFTYAASVTTPEGIVFDTATGTITDYTGAGGDLVIPDTIEGVSVTTIGRRAFDNSGLTSVTVPEGVTLIDSLAFDGNSITSVTLPSGLKTIKSQAFNNNLLTQVTLPSSVRHVAYEAFRGNSITSFTLPTINDAGFYGWYTNYGGSVANGGTVSDMIAGYIAVYEYTLTDDDVVVTNGIIESSSIYNTEYIGGHHPMHITIPGTLDSQTVTSIGERAFRGLQLVYAGLPDTVEYIGTNAFSTNFLREINLPSSLGTIDSYAFSRNGISTLNIPGNVKTIGQGAFKENALTQVTIQDGVETIESEVFYDNNLNSITFPNSVIYIGQSVVLQNNITSFTIPTCTDPEHLYWASSTGDMYVSGQQYSDGYDLSAVKEYVLTDENSTVVDGVLQEWTYLGIYTGGGRPRHIVIPETLDGQTVTEIRYNLFDSAGLFYVDLPDTITHIHEGAFRWCNLKQVDLPSSLEYIGIGAFNHNLLETIVIPEGISTIPRSCFAGNKLTSIVLPQSVTRIEYAAFENNMLSAISFSENVTYIGERAFAENILTSFNLPVSSDPQLICWTDMFGSSLANGSSVNFMDSEYKAVFEYTLTDDDVVVIDGVVTYWIYDSQVYQGSGAPVYIIMPATLDGQTVVELGEDLFNNNGLIYIDLPDTIHTIGHKAFYRCNLSDIAFPASLEVIGRDAFYSNNFETLIIPDGVHTLGDGCFSNNRLQSVSLPGSVMEIGADAFYHFPGYITSFQLPNSQDGRFIHWIDSNHNTYAGGEVVSDFTCDYSAVIEYTLTDDDVVVTDGVIQSYNYSGTGYIQGVDPSFIYIPDTLDGQTVTGVGEQAFMRKLLRGVSMADTITHLDAHAFYSNTIMYVNLSSNLERIDINAFSGNNLREISFPNTLKHLGRESFANNNLNETSPVTLPDSIRFVGALSFSVNGNLAPITLPAITEPDFLYWLEKASHDAPPVIRNAGDAVGVNNIFAVYDYTLSDDDVYVEDGIIIGFTFSGSTYKGGYNPVYFTIPNTLHGQTVVGIGRLAFNGKILIDVTLPDTLRTIGGSAFSNNYLSDISLPDTVVSIGANAFSDSGISSISLPSPADPRFTNWIDDLLVEYNAGDIIDVTQSPVYSFEAQIYYTVTDDDVVVNNGVIESYEYSGSGYIDNLIPNRIIIPDFLDGQTITQIGVNAFESKGLKYVSIPDTVTAIGESAFADNSISYIHLSNSLTEIGNGAFFRNYFKTLVFPDTLKSIGDNAFDKAFTIDAPIPDPVAMPDSIRHIGYNAFYATPVALDFVVPTITDSDFVFWIDEYRNKYYGGETINLGTSSMSDARQLTAVFDYTITDADVTVTDGVITSYAYNGQGYMGGLNPVYITIPDTLDGQTVTEIADSVFGNQGLIHVALSDTISKIGSEAFYPSYIESFVLPSPQGFVCWADSSGVIYDIGDIVTDMTESYYAIDNEPQKIAIIFAMADYVGTDNDLLGPVNDAIALGDTLTHAGYTVYRYMDYSAVDLLAAVETAASSLLPTDTLLFAYSGHGADGGYLVGSQGYGISIADLESKLSLHAGVKEVLIDACYSGDFIGRDMQTQNITTLNSQEAFNESVISVFRESDMQMNTKNLAESGYYVITAASGSQLSYEFPFDLSYSPYAVNNLVLSPYEGNYYYWMGFFSAAFEDGFGLFNSTPFSTTWADGNLDNVLTWNEIYLYAAAVTNEAQHAQVYPANSSHEIFTSNNVRVTGVTLDDGQLYEGSTLQLTHAITPSDATNQVVYYLSSDETVATVDGTGLVTGVSVGTAEITIITQDGGYTDTCMITVNGYPVESVELTPETVDINLGYTYTLTTTITPSNASNKNVTYTSSDESVATVDAIGMIWTHSEGTAIITVTTEDGGYSDTCTVTVLPPEYPVTGVELSHESEKIYAGSTLQLSAAVLPEEAAHKAVWYTSTDDAIASVDANGLVTAHSLGTAAITVTTQDGHHTDTCTITVLKPDIDIDGFWIDRVERYIENVGDTTTVEQILFTVYNTTGTIQIVDENGQVVTGDVYVGTGYKLQLIIDGQLIDELTIIIEGDVNPDGILNIIDYTLIRLHILELEILDGVSLEPADVNDDGVINIIDYTLVRLHILKLESLCFDNN